MLTHATGRRSSSPARRGPLPAARSSFGPGSPQREPRDFDTWLHNAEAFGHHFSDLPAPASPPVQRKPGESASPYALPLGLPMNALRTSFGPEPLQGFGIPEWMKKVGRGIGGAVGGLARGIGGLARGAWNLASSPFRGRVDNPPAPPVEDRRPLLAPPEAHDPEPAAPPADVPALLPPPAAAAAGDDGAGLGLLPAAPAPAAPAPAAPAPAAAAASMLIEPPSFEERQRQLEADDRAFRRRQRGGAAPGPARAAAAAPVLSAEEQAAVRARARENSDNLSGHGRAPHGARALARPASQVASNTARSRRRAEAQTLAATTNRVRRENEEKDK